MPEYYIAHVLEGTFSLDEALYTLSMRKQFVWHERSLTAHAFSYGGFNDPVNNISVM